MKKTILQHCTIEQEPLFELSKPYNQSYAQRLGFDYLTNSVRRCPERTIWWEKIAYLREMLPTLEENSLVVWEDADSINLRDESFENALPLNGIFGMVQNRAGINGSELISWYNAGVIVMKNIPIVRDFLERVWIRPDETDEAAIVAELAHNGWEVGDGIYVSSINYKWNRWPNNEHLFKNPVVQSWHGMPISEKIPSMKRFISKLPK